MTDDTKQKIENYRNTFKARAKGQLKELYIEGGDANSLDMLADNFREEAEIIFSDDALDSHLEYVDLLVDAAEKAIEESPIHPNDPEFLFDNEVSRKDLQRDGDRFERAIEDIQDQHAGESE